MSDIYKDRIDILKGFEQDLRDELIPAELEEGEDNGFAVLNVLLESFIEEGVTGRGEFFFMPSNEGDDMQIFTSVITIIEDLSEVDMSELYKAVSCINLFVEAGGFAIDPIENRLVYKHGYELPMPLDKEALKDSVNLTTGTAIQIAEEYGRYLLEISDGTRDTQDVIETITGSVQE